MDLVKKLKQLQDEARFDGLSHEAIEDGFNRCIEDAEYLEEENLKAFHLLVEIESVEAHDKGARFNESLINRISDAIKEMLPF